MVFSSKNKSYSINISIPSQNECKKLTVSEHELIHSIKEKIIKDINSPEGENVFTNNGLLLVSKKKDIRRFLSEKEEIGDLHRFASDYRLEFVPKSKILSRDEERSTSSLNVSDIQKQFIESIKTKNDNKFMGILNLGIDPNFVTDSGDTPISACIFNNKVDFINLLIDNGAHIDYKIPRGDKWISYLQYSIICKSYDCFKCLIDRGCWVDDKDRDNRTALFYAIKENAVEYVSYLLKNGANVQCVDCKGFLPIHYACKKGNEEIVRYLIDYGSDLNFADTNGNTPLHLAMKYNHRDSALSLLKRGSRKDLPNNEGEKPVDINRNNNFDEETIRMVESFDSSNIEPPPPSFDLLSTKGKKKEKDKERRKSKTKSGEGEPKKKRASVVKFPPPPPGIVLPPQKMGSDLSINKLEKMERSRSASTPSIFANFKFKPKLSISNKGGDNYKNVTAPIGGNHDSKKGSSRIANIYDSSIYDPPAPAPITTPLSRSIDLTPKTAVNPEDKVSPSNDTPRTAINPIENSTTSLDSHEDNESNVTPGKPVNKFLLELNSKIAAGNPNRNNNLNNVSTNCIYHSSNSELKVSTNDILNANQSANDISNMNDSGNSSAVNSTNDLVGGSLKNLDEVKHESFGRKSGHTPKIETTKNMLKNLVLSNPSLTGLNDSPRAAIYVPIGRKPSRTTKDSNFSASSLLNAFIKNDTTSLLDNILNIDNEKDETEDSLDSFVKDIDLYTYEYSEECNSESNPNLELIKKPFNSELIEYIKQLTLASGPEIVPVDRKTTTKIKQRNKLEIDEQDYKNTSINNKNLLLETYEKLYLVLVDLQSRSKKAKTSIEKIKEEHASLIEEIKVVREKELSSKESKENNAE